MMSGIMNKEPASSLLDMALEIQKDKGWISDDDEAVTGCKVGTTSADGVYHLDYVECIGQCETAPNVLVNGKLYSSVTRDGIRAILKEAAE